jgi:hypothetical protein
MDPARDSPGHSLEAVCAVLLAQRRGVPYPKLRMATKFQSTAGGTRRIGLVQMRCEPDFDRNLSRAQDAIEDAVRAGAEVVCLPELFRTPYLC